MTEGTQHYTVHRSAGEQLPQGSSGGLTLRLLHGREFANQELHDWGCSAPPIHGVSWVHSTYMQTITVGFVNHAAMEIAREQTGWQVWEPLVLEMPLHDDLILAGGNYFGDFELAASGYSDSC